MSAVMEMASDLLAKIGNPAYVKFYTEAKQLLKRSEEEGRYVAIDVDMVEVLQVGAKDSVKFEVDRWFKQNEAEVKGQRLPQAHAEHYKKIYAFWKNGQELPIEGTPIKGWAMIPPSQQEAIIHANVRTVEDLAQMNGEAMQRIGIGAVMLKNKAMAWVAQAQDKGPLTMKMAAMQQENDILKANMEKLNIEMKALQSESKRKTVKVRQIEEEDGGISLSDIDEDPPKRGPGRPRKEG